MRIALETVLLKLHANLSPGWVLIRVNLDPIQEIGPKVEGGHSFVSLSKVCIAKMVVVHCA